MSNPIDGNNMFDTPTSTQDLLDWCMQHTGSERIIAITAAQMALNLAKHLVDQQRTQE
mgnify:FL=1